MVKKNEYAKAIALAVECLEKEIQRVSFDANLCDILGETFNPSAVNASERRKKLREAIRILKGQPRLI